MGGILGSSEAKRRAQHSAGRSAARKTAGVFFIAEILLPGQGRGKASNRLKPGFAAVFAVLFAEGGFQDFRFLASTDSLEDGHGSEKNPERGLLQHQSDSGQGHQTAHVNRIANFRINPGGDEVTSLGRHRKRCAELIASERDPANAHDSEHSSNTALKAPGAAPSEKEQQQNDDAEHKQEVLRFETFFHCEKCYFLEPRYLKSSWRTP